MLHAYRARDWAVAGMSLGRLLAVDPASGLYGVYLQKIEEKRRNPPPSDWVGVTVFDEK
jgi:adenylate cyclase